MTGWLIETEDGFYVVDEGGAEKVVDRVELSKDDAPPVIRLVGEDDRLIAILSRCGWAAKVAGWSRDRFLEFRNDATSGDYNHLLQTVRQHFVVEEEDGPHFVVEEEDE